MRIMKSAHGMARDETLVVPCALDAYRVSLNSLWDFRYKLKPPVVIRKCVLRLQLIQNILYRLQAISVFCSILLGCLNTSVNDGHRRGCVPNGNINAVLFQNATHNFLVLIKLYARFNGIIQQV